jgi:uncharacterized protein
VTARTGQPRDGSPGRHGGLGGQASRRRPIGSAPPCPDTRHLDALLLHEFQHVKLHGLIDMYDLFDPSDVRRMPVPWRPDPRPVEGVLHGAYAHLALAHLWRSRGDSGRVEYLRLRDWVSKAAEALVRAGSLTPDGELFVALMFAAARDHPGSGP